MSVIFADSLLKSTKQWRRLFLFLGLTRGINMCVENSTSVNDEDFRLYTRGSQCIMRTCSCSVSIRQRCAPDSVRLTFGIVSKDNRCSGNTYNTTLSYRENSDDETLLWTGENKNDAIIDVSESETFSIFTTYSGCNASLTFSAISFSKLRFILASEFLKFRLSLLWMNLRFWSKLRSIFLFL